MRSAVLSDRRSARRGARWVSRSAWAIVPGLTILLAFGPASGADASSGNSGNTGSGSSNAAVVTPLLDMFDFGDTIGLPLACSDAGSIVSIIGANTQTSAATSPLVTQLDVECAQLAAQGDTYLRQAITESRSLALVNPYVDPLIAALSTGFSTVGTQYGPSLAPFGPTVAGLGGTVAFFEGT